MQPIPTSSHLMFREKLIRSQTLFVSSDLDVKGVDLIGRWLRSIIGGSRVENSVSAHIGGVSYSIRNKLRLAPSGTGAYAE